ncbi:extracellular superoxide dismutase [Cu-Zn]-like [Conger conger]|uniref:extracellular superoxide dismutase [Cu-Zn]-like n=1 Tax=Conger conger TaxID=82655 RepID=UPI002A5ABC5B|nr:extracellular superoxide dismutase [Cu-Zn]-like [Conger conger]
MRSTVNALPFALPLFLVLTGMSGGSCQISFHDGADAPPEAGQFNGTLYGACRVRPSTKLPDGQPKIYGYVLFRQDRPWAAVKVRFDLRGLPTASTQLRAIHVHQLGDLSRGCDATGGHFNPLGRAHPSHPGDFGNFAAQRGRIRELREAQGATLFGALSVLGRAVVIHEGRDDLGTGGDAGSLLHGNAGRRLACCVIGISSPSLWDRDVLHRTSRARPSSG